MGAYTTPEDIKQWNAGSEQQRMGWRAILDNFADYVEARRGPAGISLRSSNGIQTTE